MRSRHRLVACLLFSIAGVVGCGRDEVAQLIGNLQTANPPAREKAATALGRQSPNDRRIAPALVVATGDADLAVRLAAATSLLQIDPDAEAPRVVMLQAIRDGHPPILMVIGESRPAWAVEALIEQLDNRQPHIRALSARALGQIGMDSDAVLEALGRRSSDPVEPVREAARTAVEAINRGSESTP